MKTFLALAVVAALLAGGGEAKGKIINGDFQTGTTAGWTVGGTGGQVTITQDIQSLDEFARLISQVTAQGESTMTLSQTFTAQAGDLLTMDIRYVGQPGYHPGIDLDAEGWATLTEVGGAPEDIFHFHGSLVVWPWASIPAVTIPESGTYELQFASYSRVTGGGQYDTADAWVDVNNVVLTPEPTSLLLLGLGAAPMWWRRRALRRRLENGV